MAAEGFAHTRLFHLWGLEPKEGCWSDSNVLCRTLLDLVRFQILEVRLGPVRIRQIDTDGYRSIVLSLGYRWATDPVDLAFGWDSSRIGIEPVTTELRDVCIAFCILTSYHLGVARVSGFKALGCFWVSQAALIGAALTPISAGQGYYWSSLWVSPPPLRMAMTTDPT